VVPLAKGEGWNRFSRRSWLLWSWLPCEYWSLSARIHVDFSNSDRAVLRLYEIPLRLWRSPPLPVRVSSCLDHNGWPVALLTFGIAFRSVFFLGTNPLVTLRPSAMARVWNPFRHFASIKAIPNDSFSRRDNVRVSLSISRQRGALRRPWSMTLDAGLRSSPPNILYRLLQSKHSIVARRLGASKSTGGIHLKLVRSRFVPARRLLNETRFGESTVSPVDDKRETHFVCAVPRSKVLELGDTHSLPRVPKIGKASIQTDRLAEFTYRFIILVHQPNRLDGRLVVGPDPRSVGESLLILEPRFSRNPPPQRFCKSSASRNWTARNPLPTIPRIECGDSRDVLDEHFSLKTLYNSFQG